MLCREYGFVANKLKIEFWWFLGRGVLAPEKYHRTGVCSKIRASNQSVTEGLHIAWSKQIVNDGVKYHLFLPIRFVAHVLYDVIERLL